MRVSPHVHALLLNFEIELASGARIPRFVPAYVIEAERLTVVDTAVKSSAPIIFDYIESIGRKPEEIENVIHTHGHFDHVGGNGIFAERAKPRFWAHPSDRAIIENLEYQERVRPVGKMREQNTSGDVAVTDLLNDGDTIDLGGDVQVHVFHTPGHSPGSVSLFIPGDGTLYRHRSFSFGSRFRKRKMASPAMTQAPAVVSTCTDMCPTEWPGVGNTLTPSTIVTTPSTSSNWQP